MKVSEKTIQALLLDYTMQQAHHHIALPNATDQGAQRIIDWEADMLSVNGSGYLNEYEIKITRADYLKDKKKERKIETLQALYAQSRKFKGNITTGCPNYFWYVTLGFQIEPPTWAGWILVEEQELRDRSILRMKIQKRAPRLHVGKVGERELIAMGKLLSYRLSHSYRKLHRYWEPKELPV